MALRSAEAWDFLRLKQSFQESDHNAVYQDGRVLPVLIRDIGSVQQCAVEIGEQLHEAQKVNGFLRFEKLPEPIVEPPPPPTPTTDEIFAERYKAALAANPGEDAFMLRKRVAEQMHIEARSSQYTERVGQQVQGYGQLNSDVAVLAEANKRARNGR